MAPLQFLYQVDICIRYIEGLKFSVSGRSKGPAIQGSVPEP